MPEVSVIMPVWNGERYVRAAVDSVLAQTFQDFELLVVDDGSTDGTADILRSVPDPRLRVFRRPHSGIIPTRNYAVSQTRAEWVATLDADDVSLPQRLTRQMELLRQHPQSVVCHSEVTLVGDCGAVTSFGHLPVSRALLALKLCFTCPIVASTVIFRKSAFAAVGGYLLTEPHAEDYGLWGRLLEVGPFVSVREPLVQYRRHEQSDSKVNSGPQQASGERVALGHCQRFMRLSEPLAKRAYRVLRQPPKERRTADWLWFLARGVPRLRWLSPELGAWLMKQTFSGLGRKS